MSVKIYDTMTTATSNFPLAYAEKINIVKEDGSEADIQTLYNNGELSGGDTSQTLTEAEYLALPEEERLNNSYYLYDIGVHYKNGVAYSRKKPIQLTMEEYKALGEVDPDQEYIVSADEQGILLEASDIGYSNAVSNLPCTTVQGAIDKVNAKLGEKVDYKVVVEDGNRYVEDIVTQDINTWLPNDNSSILINLKKTNGINYLNFQLLCNKKDSKNWSCIVNGAANELWKIRYIDGVRYIDELATMDKVGDNIIVTPHTQICSNITISVSTLNRVEIDVAKSGYTCIGILSLQDNHGSYTQFRGWYVENNKVVVHVLSGEPYNDYMILASLLYKKN